MSKFKVGDRVKITGAGAERLRINDCGDSFLTWEIFSILTNKKHIQIGYVLSKNEDEEICNRIAHDIDLVKIEEPMMPLRKLEGLRDFIADKYAEKESISVFCKGCAYDFIDLMDEIIKEYKESE